MLAFIVLFSCRWAKIFFGKTSEEGNNSSINDEESLGSQMRDVSDKVTENKLKNSQYLCVNLSISLKKIKAD